MAEEINPTGPYNTKMPGYSDAADIQDALKLFLYGTTSVPASKSAVTGPSIANNLKEIEEDIEYLNTLGVGSIYSTTEPTTPVNGYIWVNPSAVVSDTYSITWQLKDSGSLSGSSLSVSSLTGSKIFIVLKDWSHDNSGDIDFSLRFNNDQGVNYVNTGGLITSNHLSSPTFPNSGTYDMTIEIDLANSAASLKPVSTIASISSGSYFGYYKNTNAIESLQLSLPAGTSFDAGSYEVWSYE